MWAGMERHVLLGAEAYCRITKRWFRVTDPGQTEEHFKSNLKSRESVCVLNPNWELVLQEI